MNLEESSIEEIPDEEIEEGLLDRKVASLYDIAYIYGFLKSKDEYYQIKDYIDIDEKYLWYLTPRAKTSDLFDKPDSLVSAKIDLTGESPSFSGVDVESLKNWKKAVKVGYCRPMNKSSQSTVHSISMMTSTSGSTPEDTSNDMEKILDKWIRDALDDNEDIVEEFEYGWMIRKLSEISDESAEKMKEEIKNSLQGDSKKQRIMSFKFKLEEEEDFLYPGEIDCMNEVMFRNKDERMVGLSNCPDAYGKGFDFISPEDEEEVRGYTPGLPLNYFTGKQQGFFPNFDGSKTWQQKPLNIESAVNLLKSGPILEELGKPLYGQVAIYKMPYYRNMNASKAKELYSYLEKLEKNDYGQDELINEMFIQSNHDDLRFFVTVLQREQNGIYKGIMESPDVNMDTVFNLSYNHAKLLSNDFVEESFFSYSDSNKFVDAGLRPMKDYSLFSYFKSTLYDPEFKSNSDDSVYSNDLRVILLSKVYTGRDIEYETLISSYVRRIIQEQGDRQGNNNTITIPFEKLLCQYVQLKCLKNSGLIKNPKDLSQSGKIISNMVPETREQRLKEFIDGHELICSSDERKASFVLGAFVGRLTAYQLSQNVKSTMMDRYPVDYLSKRRVKTIVNNLVEKNNQYSSSNDDVDGIMNQRYLNMLSDLMQHEDPEDWGISTDDMRFHYALGISYGYNDRHNKGDNNE